LSFCETHHDPKMGFAALYPSYRFFFLAGSVFSDGPSFICAR
jgi:hypothetical protein